MRRLINVALRGATLVSKLVLFVALAKLLEPAEVGVFGMLAATIMIGQFALGYEYCKYANRELISAAEARWPAIVRDQAAFYAVAYAALLPAMLVLFFLGMLPWSVAAWFFVLLTLEHVTHEMGRVLVAMSYQLHATALLFVRAGAWVLVAVPVMWLKPEARSLEFVFLAWAAGLAVAAAIGFGRIAAIGGWSAVGAVDWTWVRRGIAISTPFVLATLALKALSTFDRYWLAEITNLEVVGAYVFFAGIANSVKSFLDASVFTFSYPALVASAARGDDAGFRRSMRVMLWETVGVTAAVTVAILAFIEPLLEWIGKEIYRVNLALLYWTLGATFLYAIGMVAHYGNYAQHRDRLILGANAVGLAAFVAWGAAFAGLYGSLVIPQALCAAFAVILVIKTLGLRMPR